MTNVDQFKALIAQDADLDVMIEKISETANGAITYWYDGFIFCAVIVQNGRYGDIGDIAANDAGEPIIERPQHVRWFDTLEDLVACLGRENNPENM